MYAEEGEKPQSIRELWEDIEVLEKEKDLLEYKWKNFVVEGNSLSDLVKDDLSDLDKSVIESIVTSFIDKNQKNTTQLNFLISSWQESEKIDSLKWDIVRNKINFYSSLIPYINNEKSLAFKDYINSDINLNEKSKEVSVEIDRKSIERQERVQVLQEKIQENKETLRYSIEERVTELVKSRLEWFINKPWFTDLSDEQKISIFIKFIAKIEVLIGELESRDNATSIIEEKIILYKVVQNILQSYIDLWK